MHCFSICCDATQSKYSKPLVVCLWVGLGWSSLIFFVDMVLDSITLQKDNNSPRAPDTTDRSKSKYHNYNTHPYKSLIVPLTGERKYLELREVKNKQISFHVPWGPTWIAFIPWTEKAPAGPQVALPFVLPVVRIITGFKSDAQSSFLIPSVPKIR